MNKFLFLLLFVILFVFSFLSNLTSSKPVIQNEISNILDISGSGILKTVHRDVGVEIVQYYHFNNELLNKYIIEYTYGNLKDANNKFNSEKENTSNVNIFTDIYHKKYIVTVIYNQDKLTSKFYELPIKNDIIFQAEEEYMTWSFEKI